MDALDLALAWFAARLREPTTWHGLTVLLTALGVHLSPDSMQAIIGVGAAVAGFILVCTRERSSGDGRVP